MSELFSSILIFFLRNVFGAESIEYFVMFRTPRRYFIRFVLLTVLATELVFRLL